MSLIGYNIFSKYFLGNPYANTAAEGSFITCNTFKSFIYSAEYLTAFF